MTDGVPSNIWGVYSPQIFHRWGSVIYMGGLIKKRHMINRHGSKTEKETCKCAGNYGPPFDQCGDTLSPAPHKETAYDQLSCFKNGQRSLQMWGQLRSTMTPPCSTTSTMTRCQRQPIKKRHMINRHRSNLKKKNRHTLPNHGSKMDKETCKCGGNYGPPFDQCRDTLSVAPHKETAYDQSSWFKNGQRNLQMWGQLRSTVRSVP